MQFNLPADYKGKCETSSIIVTNEGVKLPERDVVFIKLHNLTVTDSPSLAPKSEIAPPVGESVSSGGIGTLNNGSDIFWGFNGYYSNQLFAGESTDYIPIKNLSQLFLKSRPSKEVVIWYDMFF